MIGQKNQIRDWVWINHPREGQPLEGDIIGVTRNRLIKVEGTVNIDKQDIVIVVKRALTNITLTTTTFL